MRRRRRNPGTDELPYGEWIPAHAVRFNEDGTTSIMREDAADGRVGNPGDRPVIHIYGEPGAWTYSMVMSYAGHPGQHYDHHFDKSFRTIEAAEKHAREHIGMPGYGGEFGTVENWNNPIVEVHEGEEGWEGAGIYGGGPPPWATQMNRGRRSNPKPDLGELINTYNDATAPYKLRTDEEHAIERERGRAALRAIRQHYVEGVDYRELSNGALWPISGRVSNTSDGFKDAAGHFHPIRWSDDYDPEEAGEPKEYSTAPSAAHYRRHGQKVPKGSPRGGASPLVKKKKGRK